VVLDQDGAFMRIALPENLAPGLFTLVLASAGGAAAAEVFLLQGEPGPLPAFREVEAAIVDCPNGGRRLFFGIDVDGNGFLDPLEERGVTIVCNGGAGIQGPPGPNGLDGPPGPTGQNGVDGINGINGTDGINGTNGTDGIDGINGINGTNGANGRNGVDGQNGELDCDDTVCILPQLLVTGGDIDVGGSLFVQSSLEVGGRTDVRGALGVLGPVALAGPLSVSSTILGGGDLDIAGNFVVDGTASAQGRPVPTSLATSINVDVTTELELRQALDALDGIIVPQGTTYAVRLAVQAMALASPVLVSRADGLRIQIVGLPPVGPRTVLVCPLGCFQIEDGGLGLLNNVDLQGPGTSAAVGVAVTGSRATIGPNTVVRAFNQGLLATSSGLLTAQNGVIVDGCAIGYIAFGNSVINAPGTFASNNVVAGYFVQFQSTIVATGARATNNFRGVFAVNGGLVQCDQMLVVGSSAEGMLVAEDSYAVCGAACDLRGNNVAELIIANRIDVRATGNSRVALSTCPALINADATSQVVP
jgi:hypothetical protein